MGNSDDSDEITSPGRKRPTRECATTADLDSIRRHLHNLSVRMTTLQGEFDALRARLDTLEGK